MKTAPPSQEAILKDGRVTFAEYEGAVLSMSACVSESGLGIEFATIGPGGEIETMPGPVLDERGRYRYGYLYHGSVASSEKVISGCKAEYLTVVENFWIVSVAPSERDIQEARSALAACMKGKGEAVEPDAAADVFSSYRSKPTQPYLDCSRRIADEYALPGFGG
jgi:hypothetical protein